jgi:hypothetical protein
LVAQASGLCFYFLRHRPEACATKDKKTMSTTLQLTLVGLLVAAAAAYVVRAAWKAWSGKSAKGCGAGCGKCATTTPEVKQEGRFPLPQA